MHLERLAFNKVKIYLTSEEITVRGLTEEEIWKNSLEWHLFFADLLKEAGAIFGLNFEGTVTVEIFACHPHGLILIVTFEGSGNEYFISNDELFDIRYFEPKRMLLYEFPDFEALIGLAHRLIALPFTGGSLYYMNGKYFLYVDEAFIHELVKLQALLEEFGQASAETVSNLRRNGKLLIEENAAGEIARYFKP